MPGRDIDDAKIPYEAPQLLRLAPVRDGRADLGCATLGSGDTYACGTGNTASTYGCLSSGHSATCDSGMGVSA